AEEVIDHQMHESIGRRERRFCIADGVKSELTEQTRRLRLPATARATLRRETEMRHQAFARYSQTKPLRAVLVRRDERHGSCGIEQDEIASSDLYDSVVVNDGRFAGILNRDVIVLQAITANVQLRSLHADSVAGDIHCSESEDAPRTHPAGEDVGFGF